MTDFTFAALTPSAFLARSVRVFGSREAVIDVGRRLTYAQLDERSRRLTGFLAALGVGPGDRVAALCANSHTLIELHHGVPMRAAVLVPLNVRLSHGELRYIIEHSGARVLVATPEFAAEAAALAADTQVRAITGQEYEDGLSAHEPDLVDCADERGLLSIIYTSGTTGRPKGVMYHHRGAYLQALAMAYHARLGADSRYLWTLPMFHCHGWCFVWAVVAAGGTQICPRSMDPGQVWRHIRADGVTHLSAAPTVLNLIAQCPEATAGPRLERSIHVGTGGAPPTPTLLARLAGLNMDVTHLYGLTETFGPAVVNDWQPEWGQFPSDRQAQLKARQGVGNVISGRVRVVSEDGADVAADGTALGEIVIRGNNVMLGYYRDEPAAKAASIDGWFRTGDLAVMHPDGYVEIRDRSKDIIISGGENIASIEVERVLDSHPAVLESAVVGVPDEVWGQIPVAFVSARPDTAVSAPELIEYVRARIAHFKAPRRVLFEDLPKTSTGKIQKNVLRQRAVVPSQPPSPEGNHP